MDAACHDGDAEIIDELLEDHVNDAFRFFTAICPGAFSSSPSLSKLKGQQLRSSLVAFKIRRRQRVINSVLRISGESVSGQLRAALVT